MNQPALRPVLARNDKRARWLIGIFSFVVFFAVVALGRFKLSYNPGFDVHLFARINAVLNSGVTLLLIAAYAAVRSKKYILHKRMMLAAMFLSILFLLSYIGHHLLAGETRFGGTGTLRIFYYFILGTHILLAACILPVILFTAYRALTAEFSRHKKLARITWPLWLYVSITGVLVYFLISPYYQ